MTIQIRSIRPAEDLDAVLRLYREQLLREPVREKVAFNMSNFPGVLATRDGVVVGFCYSVDFCPDILELANIVVRDEDRGHGIGARLVHALEERAKAEFRGIILVNSALYPPGKTGKRSAGPFYEGLGYQLIATTGPSLVFFKSLAEDDPGL